MRKVKIIYSGSFTKYLERNNIKNHSLRKKLLVLPVGIYRECLKLFQFSLKCAYLNKDINFVWRIHPVIKKKKLSQMMNINFKTLPRNIKFSKNNLKTDCENTPFVLYKSSNAVIEAIRYGCYPINLKYSKKDKFDLIAEFKNKKYISEFNNIKKILESISLKEIKKTRKLAHLYYQGLFGKVNYEKLINYLC